MACDEGRQRTTAGDPLAIDGDPGGQHQRLGIHRLGQHFGGAVGNHLPEIHWRASEASAKAWRITVDSP
jgi:hypothetical protein